MSPPATEAARPPRRVPELGALADSYDLDLDTVVARLKTWPKPVRFVGLQFPDGFRDYAHAIAQRLEREVGLPMVVSADPTFGACDVALKLDRLKVDVLVHFGHTEMPSVTPGYTLPVIFVAARHKAPVGPVMVKAAHALAAKIGPLPGPPRKLRIGLLTTAQHGHKLGDAWDALAAAGFEPVVGKGDNRVLAPGQLLGCNFTAASVVEADVDGFVYVGSGDFHPIAVGFGATKPVVLADPYTGEVRTIDAVMDRLLRQRFAAIEAAKGARTFAVLVGTHVGQERLKLALGLKRMLEAQGKEATLVALEYFSPENLQYFRHLDCWVNTGCPRITIDDAERTGADGRRYAVPMLTPQELEVVLGKRTWEEYAFDEFKGTKPAPRGDAARARRDEI